MKNACGFQVNNVGSFSKKFQVKFSVKDPKAKCILYEFSGEISNEFSNEISNFQRKLQMNFRSREFAPLRGAKFKNFTWLFSNFSGN